MHLFGGMIKDVGEFKEEESLAKLFYLFSFSSSNPHERHRERGGGKKDRILETEPSRAQPRRDDGLCFGLVMVVVVVAAWAEIAIACLG